MLLKSNISDATILSIDCAKAQIGKGQTIDISDEYWRTAEIQDALKLGFISLVGDPPKLSERQESATVLVEKLRFINLTKSKIAFECVVGQDKDGRDIKWIDYVASRAVLLVPITALADIQIQNAIAWHMIKQLDEENKLEPETTEFKADPVKLEEITNDDIFDNIQFKDNEILEKPESWDEVKHHNVKPKEVKPESVEQKETQDDVVGEVKADSPKPKKKKQAKTRSSEVVKTSDSDEEIADPYMDILMSVRKNKEILSSEEF
jgi:hypothetical protein